MIPAFRHAAFALVAAGCGLTCAPGCADNDAMIFVHHVVAPTSAAAGGRCTYSSEPTGLQFNQGALDIAFRLQYSAMLLVGNQMPQGGNANLKRDESQRVELHGTEVRVENSKGEQLGDTFTIPVAGFIDPSTGNQPSYGLAWTYLIRAGAGSGAEQGTGNWFFKKLAGTYDTMRVTAYVKVFGTTTGGREVMTGEFSYPIVVCYGCLNFFPSEAVNPTLQKQPNCQKVSDSVQITTQPCVGGQDDPIDCRLCKIWLKGDPLCDG